MRAVLAANPIVIEAYWHIGHIILTRQQQAAWGAKIIDRLASDLQAAFPDMGGLSWRNLHSMKTFAQAFPEGPIVKQAVSQLPWGQITRLLQLVRDPAARDFYIRHCHDQGWSRSTLELQIQNQLHLRQGKAQNNFALTMQPETSDLAAQLFKDPYLFELTNVRGLSLLRFPMPVVGVNSKEQPESRNYTLLHEVIHLMQASGHEETSALHEKRSGSEWETIERFAEEAASHALVPEDVLRAMVGKRPATWDIPTVKQLARRFRITALAMATRLRASGFMSWQEYNTWKQSWQEFAATLPKRSGGFAHPVDLALGRNGRPYVQLVLEALAANQITSKKLWIYDLRTNQHFTLKENPLKRESLDDFVKSYHAKNRHDRQETERFKAFDYDDLIKRDKVNLDIFWLKDEALEDSTNLPAPGSK